MQVSQVMKIPGDIKEHLLPGENVIHRVTTPARVGKEFYITDKRLIVLARSDMWVAMFGWLGMMAKKGLLGAVELNKLTAIQLKSQRSPALVGLAIFVALMFVGMGIFFNTLPDAGGFIWFFIILGLVAAGFIIAVKQSWWQFEITGLGKSDEKKWRIYRPLATRGKIDEVIKGMEAYLPGVKIVK